MNNNGISIAKNLQSNNSKKNNTQVNKKNNKRSVNQNKVVTKEQKNNTKQVIKKINNSNKDKIQQKTGSQVAPLLSKSELESEEIVLDLEDKPVASEAVKTTVEDDVEAE